MNQATEQWFILGAGAIGHMFACRFAEHELPATLITRAQPAHNIQQVVYCDNNDQTSYWLNYQHGSDVQHIKNLLLTVKSHQVEDAILGIKHALTTKSKIYLLQNGMGNLEKVTKLLQGTVPAIQIYPGTNTHGVYLRVSNNLTVVHAGIGEIFFGDNYLVDDSLVNERRRQNELNQLATLNLSIKWSDAIEQQLWLKLAVNAVINPMTAIQKCLNGELLQSESLTKEIDSLCKETAALFEILNINITHNEIIDAVYSVIDKTSNNQSSMLQDITSKKISEIDSISGHLLNSANENSIAMPHHLFNYQQITTISLTFSS
jgi:2-dehydropantoate 2-reductase